MNHARRLRLRDELAEVGFDVDISTEWGELVIAEVDYALRPHVHERRVPSVGAIIEPTTAPQAWEQGTQLTITRRAVEALPLNGARLFADGLSSWLIRRPTGEDEWAVFDRPAGSERDLVVIAESVGATVVQRHPNGTVRVVGEVGVLRWDGLSWHHEPPLGAWIDAVAEGLHLGDRDVLEQLLEFAVHDLGALGIGSILVYQPGEDPSRSSRSGYHFPHRSTSAGRSSWRRCATRWGRSTVRRCSTATACCASSVSAWCRARRPSGPSPGSAGCVTPPAGATASTTPMRR